MRISETFHDAMIKWITDEMVESIMISEDESVGLKKQYDAAVMADFWHKLLEQEQENRLTFSRERSTKKFKVTVE